MRETHGRKLADRESVQGLLGDAAMQIEIGRLLTMRAAVAARPRRLRAQGNLDGEDRRRRRAAAVRPTPRIQLCGARGYSKDTRARMDLPLRAPGAARRRRVRGPPEACSRASCLTERDAFWRWEVEGRAWTSGDESNWRANLACAPRANRRALAYRFRSLSAHAAAQRRCALALPAWPDTRRRCSRRPDTSPVGERGPAGRTRPGVQAYVARCSAMTCDHDAGGHSGREVRSCASAARDQACVRQPRVRAAGADHDGDHRRERGPRQRRVGAREDVGAVEHPLSRRVVEARDRRGQRERSRIAELDVTIGS